MFYLFRNCNCQLSYIFRNDNCWLFYLLRNHHCQLFYHFRKIIVDCFFRNTTSDCFIFLEVTIANCFIHFLGKSTFISVIHFLFMYICFAAAAGCFVDAIGWICHMMGLPSMTRGVDFTWEKFCFLSDGCGTFVEICVCVTVSVNCKWSISLRGAVLHSVCYLYVFVRSFVWSYMSL